MTGPAVAGLEGKVGFSLTVPESWFELDVHPATRDDSIRRLVEERVRGNDAMWEARHGVTRILRQEARKAWDAGAAYSACMVHPTDDGPITASVVVSLVRGPVGATADGDPTGFVAERLTVVPKKDDDDLFTSVTTVEIPDAGHCARSYGVEDLQVDSGFIRTAFMQTFVPVPGANKVFIVSASSPVVALAAELHDLFDAVTGTFRLVDVSRGAGPAEA